jgi:hypothetical protein
LPAYFLPQGAAQVWGLQLLLVAPQSVVKMSSLVCTKGAEIVPRGGKKRDWPPFEEVRKVARSLKFKGSADYFANRPRDLPAYPDDIYKKSGWIDWSDFLGRGRQRCHWPTFDEARSLARSLKFKTRSDYFYNRPKKSLPSDPEFTFKDQWTNWDDFLGVDLGYVGWPSFEEARQRARDLHFKTGKDYQANRPTNLPYAPHYTYRNAGWTNWGDFLGTGSVASAQKGSQFHSFEKGTRSEQTIRVQEFD